MCYKSIATTVYTYPEYGYIGLTEEDVKAQNHPYEVYHLIKTPLENDLDGSNDNKLKSYFKVIVDMSDSQNRIMGLHYIGPNAGEICQGFATAMRLGMTKDDLDATVGIHPTVAENVVSMKVTKSSGESPEKTSC